MGLCQLSFIDPFCNSTANGICQQCFPYFQYNANTMQCESVNCLEFTGNMQGRPCNSCQQGYNLNQGTCVPYYCTGYTANIGLCTSCVAGASLVSGICAPNNCRTNNSNSLCTSCQQNYQLTASGLCTPSNCVTFANDLTCTNCNPGFSPVNGVCINSTCNPGFVFISSSCQAANCINFNANLGGCQTCLPGFTA